MSRKLWFEDKTGDDIDFYSETDSDNIIYNLHEDCLSMKEEINELKAYIERLRDALNDMVERFIPKEGSGADSRGVDDVTVAACVALFETPSQSLNHLLAQVEEETIERCISALKAHNPPHGALSELAAMHRKYKEQSDED